MKKILIITPHFPPSNLTAVHRSRFTAQHLPAFGWEPIILTVHEDYYEEALDRNLEKMLPAGLRVEKVKAWKVGRPRLIGDIGLRGFRSLYRRAKAIIRNEKIDFLFIPIPSFYAALLGRLLHESTGIKYGIDYIDPWVHEFAGSNKIFSRHWFATKISTFLEPIAVKKASLITGVAEGYYEGVVERNPHLKKQALFKAIPFGIERTDMDKLKLMNLDPYIFKKDKNKIQLVYAGTMLPKAYEPLEVIFQVMQKHIAVLNNVEIYFIGSGKSPNDKEGYNIKPLAEKYGLWQTVVFEHPDRIPYLDVLLHLDAATGVFILGSTEAHYTPSKVYQAIMAGKPILAVLHQDSTAVDIINEGGEGAILSFAGDHHMDTIRENLVPVWKKFTGLIINFDKSMIKYDVFESYSAKRVTEDLVEKINEIVDKSA